MEMDFSKQEKKLLKFWKENKVFEKSVQQPLTLLRSRKRVRGDFVFYEGPPTANAKAGIHHVLARVYKDVICRYKTMAGFRVLRKAGWDTHGLPVEIEIEKKLGLKSKKDIEKYGIAKFNKECKESVWRYKQDWEKLTERIGYWLDMERPYITYDNDYIESVWWLLKQIWQKGLLGQDYKVVPYCPRCGTSLSSHEVAQGYKRVKDTSISVKFQIPNSKFQTNSKFQIPNSKTSLLVWTTTPWTLPGNVAVAVNPEFVYAKAKVGDGYLILAKERIKECGIEGEIINEFKGKDLVGLEYEPLYQIQNPKSKIQNPKFYKVISANFVSLDEGTGLVHIAPAFGEDDMIAAKRQFPISNFQFSITVDEEGKMLTPGYGWDKLFVKEADPLIIEDLKKRGFLFREELYEHDYPFCWRCKTPLIYYAKKSWFIKMTKVKEELIRNNQKINWIPANLKEGRFGEWLNELKDWAVSRERYWGTPLPIWLCQSQIGRNQKSKIKNQKYNSKIKNKKICDNIVVISSREDLLKQKFSNNRYFILRHGHSQRQLKNLSCCWPEKFPCPLTEKGKKEVKKSAGELKDKKIDLIFSSDSLRAKQTAEIISQEIGAKIIFDKRLREFNVGVFNGKTPKLTWEYLKKKKDKISTRLPGGESLIDIRKRAYEFLEEINKKEQNKNILIVSHELPLSFLEKTLMGWSIERILEWRRKDGGKIRTAGWRKIEFKEFPFNEKMELDFHRPFIDKVKFKCPRCGGLMERVPEVIDCWFDSGAMPFAQGHWPFAQDQRPKTKDQRLKPPELFPADYICEAIDQTRGWFYTLLAISTLLGFGAPYKNVISVGHVLDEKGEKMSKSKGNVVDPWYIVEKYGADASRWYFYTVNQPGEPKLFSEKDVEQALKKFIMTFWNVFSFFETYVLKKEFQNPKSLDAKRTPRRVACQIKSKIQNPKTILDRWIISRLNWLILDVSKKLDDYDITGVARDIEDFVINDLSLWYVRRSRRRFQRPESEKELTEAAGTLGFVLVTLSKITAPFIPFISEDIYKNVSSLKFQVSRKMSVHLEDWPKADKKLVDKELENKMKLVRELVTEALSERAKAGIKVRQPLLRLKIKDLRFKIEKELLELVKDEVNVKEIIFDPKIKKELELDTKITPELKEEGMVREIIRQIQEMRKLAGYKPGHRILVRYSGSAEMNDILARNKDFIVREIKTEDFLARDKQKGSFDAQKELVIDGQKLWLGIRRIH